ncbi:1-deoxy-D-xylulose-5-phosphate synthase [Tessaracoccus sp. MC1865]|uniref:1-deoxy-D-xylulose-5-phosphate synthase n=1 Tax=Tessaracoccus sp. MC1865 TaxID=2760310 RepID=UPI0016020127|nr:1-deoxy-D-xylulose-5-phosphate synthase [Tessaracoccus sp. MC1865]MBB1483312.1 1-deoxy-D-xylulose-5-phosphate synthase [Tessaracoccus sp. MC1865]QTO36430.1 1-deoxy-D-xylulose-5-phosphate synthase [Tessaracoccus sp. MC1865]
MSLLDSVHSPHDLRALSRKQLVQLADEIRRFLITKVSRTGGHLGPNLGVVELTMAIHKVFDSPSDPIIFDTGHQSYVHKILTGRAPLFDTLRQQEGISGYPEPDESEHDWVRNSHASSALSWAEGLAKGFRIRGEDRTVVAVVGDGALTGGMAWEALNNIADAGDLRLVVIVNDNGRSYTPTVGGLANHLAGLRTDHRYEKTLSVIKRGVKRVPVFGRPVYDLMHGFKTGVKDVLAPQTMFSDIGIKYTGPIDGHDITALTNHLEQARQFGGPVIVHCVTRKGRGFPAAEEHEEDRFHAVGKINEFTGEPLSATVQATWTDAFAEAIVQLGQRRPDLVAITGAMLNPTGLGRFAAAFPDRIFDVGIAEQHAVVSAAGLARAGLHPVVALYATFLNRALDQVLMDAALHKAGITLVLDRAGVTGTDGPSHNGMWDMTLLGIVPHLQLAAPRDQTRLVAALDHAVEVDDAVTVVRYSKERLPDEMPEIAHVGEGINRVDVLIRPEEAKVLIVGYGQFVGVAMDLAERLDDQGVSAAVVDPLWALPVSPDLVALASGYDLVVTLEDNLVDGGVGQRLGAQLAMEDAPVKVRNFGIPKEFLKHGSRDEVLERIGLTAAATALSVLGDLLSTEVADVTVEDAQA